MGSLGQDRCWAEIDCAALRHNARIARERVGPSTSLLAVVKANGYGHGMVEIADALRNEVDLFGVADLGEALKLRKAIATKPIMLLGAALPQEREAICSGGFIPSVSNLAESQAFAGNAAGINFAIDTGMGRMGCWQDDAIAELEKMARIPGLKIHSISTHLPVAEEDASFTENEINQFSTLVREMRRRVPGNYKVHVLLSAGILSFPQHHFDLVRAGLMLYGSSPVPDGQKFLRPVMALKSRIALLSELPAGRGVSYGRTFITTRTTQVATISAGYADGFPRSISNQGGEVLIGGRRCPLLGRITMDLMMADVSEVPRVQLGDEVVLIGKQGVEEILAGEVAQRSGTIPWEIFTRIGTRVRRLYL